MHNKIALFFLLFTYTCMLGFLLHIYINNCIAPWKYSIVDELVKAY